MDLIFWTLHATRARDYRVSLSCSSAVWDLCNFSGFERKLAI